MQGGMGWESVIRQQRWHSWSAYKIKQIPSSWWKSTTIENLTFPRRAAYFFAWLLSDTSEQWHQWIAQVLWWDSIRLPINLEIENNNMSTVVENSESLLYTFMNRIYFWNNTLKTSSVNPGMPWIIQCTF